MSSTPFPVEIERTIEGDYRLHWGPEFSESAVRLRAHSDPHAAATAHPVHDAATPGVRVPAPDQGHRHYFHLQPGDGEAITAAQREVVLDGGTNFRDLGGYRNADGQRVRWGRLFRSGHTARFSERDQAIVAALGIRVCCDFRREEEQRIEPIRLPQHTRIVAVTINPGSSSTFFDQIASGGAVPDDMAAFMQEINRDFVLHNTAQYQRMFEELLALEDGGFMINCSAGKDRTGFGAAMILAALGVAEQDILADYMLSKRYFPIERELERVLGKYGAEAGGNLGVELIMPMLETREEYLRAAFDAIRAEYGSVERFLSDALAVGAAECQQLRARLTA